MKRLTVHLNKVEKTKDNKIFNTLSFVVKSESEIASILSDYKDNIKKHYITFLS